MEVEKVTYKCDFCGSIAELIYIDADKEIYECKRCRSQMCFLYMDNGVKYIGYDDRLKMHFKIFYTWQKFFEILEKRKVM